MNRCLLNACSFLIAGQALAAPDLALTELAVVDLSDRACIRRAALRITNHGTETAWGVTVSTDPSDARPSTPTQITQAIHPGADLLLLVCRPPLVDRRYCVEVSLLRLAESDRKEPQRRDNRRCWFQEPPPLPTSTAPTHRGEHP